MVFARILYIIPKLIALVLYIYKYIFREREKKRAGVRSILLSTHENNKTKNENVRNTLTDIISKIITSLVD